MPAIGPSRSEANTDLQLAGDRLGLRGLDRHDRKRHPLHGVDVEQRDRVHHPRDILAAAGQRDQVAGVVDADDAAARRDRLEHAPDLGRGDILELHHLQAGTDLLGIGAVVGPEAGRRAMA